MKKKKIFCRRDFEFIQINFGKPLLLVYQPQLSAVSLTIQSKKWDGNRTGDQFFKIFTVEARKETVKKKIMKDYRMNIKICLKKVTFTLVLL